MKKKILSAALSALLLIGASSTVFAGSTSGSWGPPQKPAEGTEPATVLPYTEPSIEKTNWSGIYSIPSNFYVTPSTDQYGEYAIHWNDEVFPAATLVPFDAPQSFYLQTYDGSTEYAGYGQFCKVEVKDGKVVETPIIQDGKALVVLRDYCRVVLTADVNEDGSFNSTISMGDYYDFDMSRIFDFSWNENTPIKNQQMEITNRVVDLDQLGGVLTDETISYDGPVYQATPSMDFSITNFIQGSSITLTVYEQTGTQKYKQKASYVILSDGYWYDAEKCGSYNTVPKETTYRFSWKAEKGTLYHFEYFRPGWAWSGGSYYFQVAGEPDTPDTPVEPEKPVVVPPSAGTQTDGSYIVNSDTVIPGFTLSLKLPPDSEVAAPSAVFVPIDGTPERLASQLERDGSFSALTPSAQGTGRVTFRTEHFSLYGLARKVNRPSPGSGSSSGFTSYWITAEAGPNGAISPDGENRVAFGDSLTVTVTPNAGYIVDKVVIDGAREVTLTNNQYTFKNVNEPYTIKATFKKASGTAEAPAAPEAKPAAPAAVNPATGDNWFAHLFDGLFH